MRLCLPITNSFDEANHALFLNMKSLVVEKCDCTSEGYQERGALSFITLGWVSGIEAIRPALTLSPPCQRKPSQLTDLK